MPKRGVCAEPKRVNFCDMHYEEREKFLQDVAKNGALQALEVLGLTDPEARKDIKDLRELISSYRIVKKNIWTTTITVFGRVIAWILIILVVGFLVGHTDAGKSVAKILTS